MDWKEFKEKYNSGIIKISIDKSIAMALMDKRNKFIHEMFSARKSAHHFWLNIALLSMTIAIISGIWWFFVDYINGWIPVGTLISSFLISASVRTSACQFVIEECLENEKYYNMIKYEQDIKGAIILKINYINQSNIDSQN